MNSFRQQCVGLRGISAGRRCGLVFAALFPGLIAGCLQSNPPAAPPTLAQAQAAYSAGEYAQAEQLAAAVAADSRDWVDAQFLAGESAQRDDRLDQALGYYLAVAERSSKPGEKARGHFYAGEIHRSQGRLVAAEAAYRATLNLVPNDMATIERLAFLISATGRRWESLWFYDRLIRSGSASIPELVVRGDLDRAVEQRDFLEECARQAPHDRHVKLGLAAHDLWDGLYDSAGKRLASLLAEEPQSEAAHVLLGEILIHGDDVEFQGWSQRYPSEPVPADVWYFRGLKARQHNAHALAAKCFWRSIHSEPSHRRAMYQLGQVLTILGDPAAAAVTERAALMTRLTQSLDEVLSGNNRDDGPLKETAHLLERMGRVWEACAWAIVARQVFPEANWTTELLHRLASRLNDQLPATVDEANLALRYDWQSLPEFDRLLNCLGSSTVDRGRVNAASTIRFEESPNGPDFVYFNGADPTTPGARQFEQLGGGVGILDFDGDHWPDLFFPQGQFWKTGASQPELSEEHRDRLFRNAGGQSFIDVTSDARIEGLDFGQGCAVGDFDNDGFPDLYVANIGGNRLYHNNGDGTFRDVSKASGLDDQAWTASCVIVDMNGDGLPDLYDANYLTGAGVYEKICHGRACSPALFEGAPNRLSLNRGDGTFVAAVRSAAEIDGKSLGVVAFDMQQRGRPCLFIANDQVPDQLLWNTTSAGGDRPLLPDEGFSRGVAFNQDGLAMASMGVAADDINGDGLIDLLITTFENEAAVLLIQDTPGLFVDATSASGLHQPTWPYVGWGAQFLDADLDGLPDLVLVNGHVEDYRDRGGAYQMRPQVFRNSGRGRFVELSAQSAGAFFDQPRLGRGLARLDWNRDGRMDFAVSYINDRAALVTNITESAGGFLTVRLIGRTLARDAIGTTVRVSAGENHWQKQLVAGDGYMASNERLLAFGLSDTDQLAEVHIIWPSGHTSTLRDLPADAHLTVIESSTHADLTRTGFPPTMVDVVTGRVE